MVSQMHSYVRGVLSRSAGDNAKHDRNHAAAIWGLYVADQGVLIYLLLCTLEFLSNFSITKETKRDYTSRIRYSPNDQRNDSGPSTTIESEPS